MKSALRHDFYLIFHSCAIIVCMVACALYAVSGPIISSYAGSRNSILVTMQASASMSVPLIVMTFAIAFCTRDFASGYIKNTYISSKKIYYILSKIIIIFSFAVVTYFLIFLVQTIVNAAWGNAVFYSLADGNGVPLWKFVLIELMRLGLAVVIGMVVLAFCCICKYGIVVALVTLSYFFLHSFLEQGVNLAIGHGCAFEFYSLFGGATNIAADLPSKFQWACFGVMIGFGILSFLIAWLAYSRKSY